DALGISSYGEKEKAYYQNLIDNAEATKQERIAANLEEVLETKDTLEGKLAGNQEKLGELSKEFATEFADVDMTDVDAVKTKISELLETEGGAEKYASLKEWSTEYDKTTAELEQVNAKLTAKQVTDENGNLVDAVDEDGNVIYELNVDIVAGIEAEVDEEVASAGDILNQLSSRTGTAANKIDGQDAEIVLNGVLFTSSSNTFEINGLTMTMNATTAPNEEITVTTQDDTDGIYDMIKGFFKEYNALINQMDKLYNADSSDEYEPLTDEEKAEMSEDAVKEWETKIKDGLLRRDSTISTVASAMKQVMMSGFEVNGQKMYLNNFGIETMSYFLAPENEKNAYHIAGDPDDTATSGSPDKLKAMIASDPDTVVDFFTQLSREMYSKMSDLMKATDYSSSYTVYDDKKMKSDYEDYTSKIAELEDKLHEYEDNWYAKFARMETAMAKMQSNASAVTSLIGG
ncbi:MAG: flagellar filament capping protein FliD, partial [Lachnospiraceae bacterium]|nr:flagellar filament capping protein FliD [Lachnospiraceae bacterium]